MKSRVSVLFAALVTIVAWASADRTSAASIDLNADGVFESVRSEIRLHVSEPVVSRILMIDGATGEASSRCNPGRTLRSRVIRFT